MYEEYDGFAVITGDIGTGKPTLCRALLERLDRQIFSALVLNPFLSVTDLLKSILRLTVAGGRASVIFRPPALETIHRLSQGIPRVINLLCDRALLAGFAGRTNVRDKDFVKTASESLDLPRATQSAPALRTRLRRRAATVAVALGLFVLIGTAGAGLECLPSEGSRVTVIGNIPLIVLPPPVEPSVTATDTASSTERSHVPRGRPALHRAPPIEAASGLRKARRGSELGICDRGAPPRRGWPAWEFASRLTVTGH